MSVTPSPPWVLDLKPYVPGTPIETIERELGITGIVKLASNENPLGPSPRAIGAMRDAATKVHLYPDAGTFALRARLAEHLGVDAGRVVIGNGSNEILTLLVRAFATPEHNVVVGEYGFVAYRVVSGAAGVAVRSVDMPGLTYDLEAMTAACDDDTRLLFVANPNNPTGTWCTRDAIVKMLREVPEHVMVVIDEAYFEYVDDPSIPDALTLLDERENLVVTRTFSKAYGLAGCRVGYAVTPPAVADRLNRIREPFNANLIGQAAAIAGLDDPEHVERGVRLNRVQRAALEAWLDGLGIRWTPSQCNFVLIESPIPGGELYERMLPKGVIVRPMGPYRLPNHVRVSIGTATEMEKFRAAFEQVLAEVAS